MPFARPTVVLLSKELRTEFRTRELLATTLVFVLMVLAPTTKTGLEWHPYTAAPSKELCETRAPADMENWSGKTPVKWTCVAYSRF